VSETVQTVLAVVVPLAIGALCAGAVYALAKLGQLLGNKAKANRMWLLLVKVEELAVAIVRDVEATVKPEAQRLTADGRLSPDEARRLRDLAMARLKTSLGERGREQLGSVLGLAGVAVEGFLAGKVESAVAAVKQGPVSAAVDWAAVAAKVGPRP